MSLDLYIKSQRPVRHRGTGVFVRDNGQTRELKTLAEVREHFPDADLTDVHVTDYEDDKPDFQPKPLTAYNLLWHPETNPLLKHETLHRKDEDGEEWDVEVTRIDAELVRQVMAVQHYTAHHREKLERYNPDNGWGTYDQLLRATQDLLIALLDIPVSDYGDYFIYCST